MNEPDLYELAPLLADARDKWWTAWEEANLDSNGRSTFSYDIEQGWGSAWECIEEHYLRAWRAGERLTQ